MEYKHLLKVVFMKKIFIFFVLIIFLFGGCSYGAGNSSSDGDFYDEILNQMFSSMQDGLISRGYNEGNVKRYITVLRGRVNKAELVNMTSSCMSKYSDIKSHEEQIANDCFTAWITKFIAEDNTDLLEIIESQKFNQFR